MAAKPSRASTIQQFNEGDYVADELDAAAVARMFEPSEHDNDGGDPTASGSGSAIVDLTEGSADSQPERQPERQPEPEFQESEESSLLPSVLASLSPRMRVR